MSRLLEYLGDKDVDNPSDVDRLRREIPELALLSGKLIEQMYRDFSDLYCASWMILDDDTLASFRRWLT